MHLPLVCYVFFLSKVYSGFRIFSRSTTTAFIRVLKLFMNEKKVKKKDGKEDGLGFLSVLQGLCPAVVCSYSCIYALERDGVCIFGFMLK